MRKAELDMRSQADVGGIIGLQSHNHCILKQTVHVGLQSCLLIVGHIFVLEQQNRAQQANSG